MTNADNVTDSLRDPPDCGHDVCCMEAALHECGKCTEIDHIVPGVYCPHSVCRMHQRRVGVGEGEP